MSISLREIARLSATLTGYFSVLLIIPALFALSVIVFSPRTHIPDYEALMGFSTALLSGGAIYFLLRKLGKGAKGVLYRKESILLVVGMWVLLPLIAAIPFVFSQAYLTFSDAYFDAVSGLTTTGATALSPQALLEGPAEKMGLALIFWRNFLQWIGGIGIVVLFLYLLPVLSTSGKMLFETEIQGPDKESLTPRVKHTARLIFQIYLGLTLLQIILLYTTNPTLSLLDASCVAFSTISTGGFSFFSTGLDILENHWTQGIVMTFMILGSINFSLYYYCLRGKFYLLNQRELKYFLGSCFFSMVLVVLLLWSYHSFTFSEAFRKGSFEAIAAHTSTGYSIQNYQKWPPSVQVVLIFITFIGGMSGSTAGGLKVSRWMIAFKGLSHSIRSLYRPHEVRSLSIGERTIADSTLQRVLLTILAWFLACTVGVFLLVFDGSSLSSSFTIITSMINNAGLTFIDCQGIDTCSVLPHFSKAVCCAFMLLGRIELFAALALFFPSFWKNNR